MPLNIPGLLVPFHLLINPRLILPHLTIQDVRQLDFQALKRAGYRGAVFDKDNCLTLPHKDGLVPELETWIECLETFGPGNVLVVSNSAGSRDDPGGLQAESVSHALGAPVLHHASPKPAYSCAALISRYFAALPRPLRADELVVVGDRVFTDVVLANRMRDRKRGFLRSVMECGYENGGAVQKEREGMGGVGGPLAVLCVGVWKREATVMRWCEKGLVGLVRRWTGVQENREYDTFIKKI
ncbi:mitochondrial PGP phosphatase-domain-containing protein [Infundibulicybe gibba]|nr:mitochondrial PGP phosphatase-domain-containing protein [Infundibulicybe gibba]